MSSKWIVITTINPPSQTIKSIGRLCESGEWSAVVVGDTRTPEDWHSPHIDFLDVNAQREEFGAFADAIPYKHYSRKNLGYLYAIRRGAEVILETDDDNNPYESFGYGLKREVTGRTIDAEGWVNVYPHFHKRFERSAHAIWPRGLPLDAIGKSGSAVAMDKRVEAIIQQFLADNDPDVDAIYRLLDGPSVFFDQKASPLILDGRVWSPFNSQNTVFFREAFPLLYLPCHVSFRMTDIWRSFVAQAALTAKGYCWSFHTSTVEQLRNNHDLMRDFEDEVPGYLKNKTIGRILEETKRRIAGDETLAEIAFTMWKALADAGILSAERELLLVKRWFEELELIPLP